MIYPDQPALVLAPMEGITDAPMRELQGLIGAFSYSVSEFQRVSIDVLPLKVFLREIPELSTGAQTASGLPVHVQLLGGDAERMAASAVIAVQAGATAIDINFGCPAPTVNRHDGGASLLKSPLRIREVVRAVREAVPPEIPVSAKLRLGWDNIDQIHQNAQMAADGGASWLTIHARTRTQGYLPPVYWPKIGQVRKNLGLPVVANGDIWTIDDFRQCQDETGCRHFMIGRSALANPGLSHQIAQDLGLPTSAGPSYDWVDLFRQLIAVMDRFESGGPRRYLMRLKQWSKLAHAQGNFLWFHELKRIEDLEAFLEALQMMQLVGVGCSSPPDQRS